MSREPTAAGPTCPARREAGARRQARGAGTVRHPAMRRRQTRTTPAARGRHVRCFHQAGGRLRGRVGVRRGKSTVGSGMARWEWPGRIPVCTQKCVPKTFPGGAGQRRFSSQHSVRQAAYSETEVSGRGGRSDDRRGAERNHAAYRRLMRAGNAVFRSRGTGRNSSTAEVPFQRWLKRNDLLVVDRPRPGESLDLSLPRTSR